MVSKKITTIQFTILNRNNIIWYVEIFFHKYNEFINFNDYNDIINLFSNKTFSIKKSNLNKLICIHYELLYNFRNLVIGEYITPEEYIIEEYETENLYDYNQFKNYLVDLII